MLKFIAYVTESDKQFQWYQKSELNSSAKIPVDTLLKLKIHETLK